jgi:hypothetical protein
MACTGQFGTYINVSQFFYAYLTRRMKKYLRLVDKVTVKGSSIPIKIYCFDFNVAGLGGNNYTILDDDLDQYDSKENTKETCKWFYKLIGSVGPADQGIQVIQRLQNQSE